jgi:hypothetical protein
VNASTPRPWIHYYASISFSRISSFFQHPRQHKQSLRSTPPRMLRRGRGNPSRHSRNLHDKLSMHDHMPRASEPEHRSTASASPKTRALPRRACLPPLIEKTLRDPEPSNTEGRSCFFEEPLLLHPGKRLPRSAYRERGDQHDGPTALRGSPSSRTNDPLSTSLCCGHPLPSHLCD